jgi:hypothetical protein
MNLAQTIQLYAGRGVKAGKGKKKKKKKDPSEDMSAQNENTFYGPNTDMGPAKALDPE